MVEGLEILDGETISLRNLAIIGAMVAVMARYGLDFILRLIAQTQAKKNGHTSTGVFADPLDEIRRAESDERLDKILRRAISDATTGDALVRIEGLVRRLVESESHRRREDR